MLFRYLSFLWDCLVERGCENKRLSKITRLLEDTGLEGLRPNFEKVGLRTSMFYRLAKMKGPQTPHIETNSALARGYPNELSQNL